MKQRYISYDAMRIVAVFLVLMNHQPAYSLYFVESGMGEVFSLLMSVIIRINVPLFAMISGALLLGREETISKIWHKRISRILWVILIFSGLLYVELGWLRDRTVNFHDFFYGLMAGNLKSLTSYWYLYAYLGFLLMLPFIRKVAVAMTKVEFLWLIGIHVVFSTLFPLISFFLKISGEDALSVSGTIGVPLSSISLLFYPLIGYYLDKHIDVEDITKRQWGILLGVCLLCSAISATAIFIEGVTWKFTQHYVDLFTYVNVIAAFLVIKKIFSPEFAERHIKTSTVINIIAPLTFGIYLLDLAVQLPIYRELKSSLRPVVGTFWFSVMWCTISFVLGGLITYIFRKLPFFKKIL